MEQEKKFECFTLSNNIRLVHQQTDAPVSHLGFIFNAGTRDEAENEGGIAHFIEHCIFKGTKKRKTYHIFSRLEDVGGELNAYTTKEDICIHSSFLNEYYGRTMEVLCDISFNSTFPAKEIEKERDVILDEINSYKEIPSEMIFEEIEDYIFPSHPLGRPILGTPESVGAITRNNLFRFITGNFSAERTIICSSGNISAKKLLSLAEKYFAPYNNVIAKSKGGLRRIPPVEYTPRLIEKQVDTVQSHILLANRAWGLDTDQAVIASLLNNILGGPAMCTRLNMSLREKHALAYNIESFFTPYTDCGIFGIYVGTDTDTSVRCIELIHKELHRLQNTPLGAVQLSKAKKQMAGQMAIAAQGRLGNILSIGRSILSFDKVDTLPEIIEKVEGVTAMQIMDIARQVFDREAMTTLIYNPKP